MHKSCKLHELDYVSRLESLQIELEEISDALRGNHTLQLYAIQTAIAQVASLMSAVVEELKPQM